MMVSSIDKCSRSRTAVLPNLTRAETFLRLKRETNKQTNLPGNSSLSIGLLFLGVNSFLLLKSFNK